MTLYEYDLAGRLTALVDAKSNRTEFRYDADGRRFVKFPAGNFAALTKYVYDAPGLAAKRPLRAQARWVVEVTAQASFPGGGAALPSNHGIFQKQLTYGLDGVGNRDLTTENGTPRITPPTR